MNSPISVTILTKNSHKYIEKVINALLPFDEILIYDNGSTDDTLKIIKDIPLVNLYSGNFIGFGPTHNKASILAKNDWILSIDSDEILSPELLKEIFQLKLEPGCVYSFPRHNLYKGKWIKWCGWHPDRQIRLYNRKQTQFSNAHVHETIVKGKLKEVKLKSPLLHYSYETVSDFLKKMQSYSDLFAEQYKGKKSSSMSKAIMHGCFAFFKSYIIKQGFLGGCEGLEISIYNANTAFYKYLKLAEANAIRKNEITNASLNSYGQEHSYKVLDLPTNNASGE